MDESKGNEGREGDKLGTLERRKWRNRREKVVRGTGAKEKE